MTTTLDIRLRLSDAICLSSSCLHPLKGAVNKFPLRRIIFFCRLKVLEGLM
jgi:hypothetical protein